MTRPVAALLLCCSLLLAATAAPVPPYRPRPANDWTDGWGPPGGAGRFERKGEKLIVSLDWAGPATLLREAEGDFMVQVRVGGGPGHHDLLKRGLRLGREVTRRAGLVLTDGKDAYAFGSIAGASLRRGDREEPSLFCSVPGRGRYLFGGPDPRKPVHLRLTRRGDDVEPEYSLDGKAWSAPDHIEHILDRPKLPRRVKVGVVVEAMADPTFWAEFDEFKFTRLTGRAKP